GYAAYDALTADLATHDIPVIFVISCFFFFSSRRRHTSSLRDWSSDVCSSDLASAEWSLSPPMIQASQAACFRPAKRRLMTWRARSEERRVGKECRARWSAEHQTKNEQAQHVEEWATRSATLSAQLPHDHRGT